MNWNREKVEVINHEVDVFSVLICCKSLMGSLDWVFNGVYGPNVMGEVDDFLRELDDVKARWNLPW